MSTSDTTNALLTVNRALGAYASTGRSAGLEGSLVYPRGLKYGEFAVQNLMGVRTPALVDEGSAWIASNVPGTAIVDAAALTAFVATTPTMVIFNNNTVASDKWVYPQRLKMNVAAAGTNGTNWLYQWLLDTGNRKTSGGTVLTAAALNLNVANTVSACIATFGAITAPAANASRIISSGTGRTVIKVIGDEYIFEFGNSAATAAAGMPTEGTLQLSKTFQVPAVGIPPQCSLLFYEYAASQSVAAQFDYITFEYTER